jgi:hypothetical protein
MKDQDVWSQYLSPLCLSSSARQSLIVVGSAQQDQIERADLVGSMLRTSDHARRLSDIFLVRAHGASQLSKLKLRSEVPIEDSCW